ncbi:Integrator complex subunit 11 [Zancudomyces culisetae]|uniref:Integrator complex subunit 11 n=1 Tax=Zancudomyces culisetae TaxID=1213189 RepID=A0A1R1PIK8_ZANCU|nr:Integrator complex subunit 11 [Zancudomyces culisetae]|eukprot:OMH80814.1 Integrator complex subunit 11 [Zancudomyces culisetae]
MKIIPLGAGQDVGKSCVIVTLNNKTIMFDCGMHMGHNDEKRFPDFSLIAGAGSFTERIDALVITHFHLDHCGALPHFTEQLGYDGPIYMTAPTKAICPILLEDYRKITVEKKGETNFFTTQNIRDCMNKVVTMNLHETIMVDEELELRAYYAGHVLGAAMVYAKCGNESVLYTGDYNMTPDRHLGAAWVDRIKPTVLITESTYGTTIRDSKRARERDFLEKVHSCVKNGGKVLIPCFALGRAQELCILVETYWERMELTVPVYFSAGLTEKANRFYKLFINWTNQKVKNSYVKRNPFDFKYIKPWKHEYMDLPGPMVTFATPGMLHIGMSLEIFKKWAPDPKNMLIIPGYCVANTVGAKVLNGDKQVDVDPFTKVNVNLRVENLSFSAHADAKGIMELIRHASPKNVVLVHGEKSRMEFLHSKIKEEFHLPCFFPANGEMLDIDVDDLVKTFVSSKAVRAAYLNSRSTNHDWVESIPLCSIPFEAVLVRDSTDNTIRLVSTDSINPSSSVPSSGSSSNLPLPIFYFSTFRHFDGIKLKSKFGLQDSDNPESKLILLLHDTLLQSFGISGNFLSSSLASQNDSADSGEGSEETANKKFKPDSSAKSLTNIATSHQIHTSLFWCGVSIKIPPLESRGDEKFLNLLQISWELKSEEYASIVFAALNKILSF